LFLVAWQNGSKEWPHPFALCSHPFLAYPYIQNQTQHKRLLLISLKPFQKRSIRNIVIQPKASIDLCFNPLIQNALLYETFKSLTQNDDENDISHKEARSHTRISFREDAVGANFFWSGTAFSSDPKMLSMGHRESLYFTTETTL